MTPKLKVKLVLQLREQGLNRTEIASSRHISRKNVNEIFSIAQEKGLTYKSVKALSEDEVYELIYPDKYKRMTDNLYTLPDYSHIHSELKRVGVTLRLLWLEYSAKVRSEGGVPVKYTKYCLDYRNYVSKHEFTSHIDHKPGYRCEVAWSGPTMKLNVGNINVPVYLFVACLTYSQYVYVEPCLDMKLNTWLGCHINMYRYFGGVPVCTVCDNLKTGVVKHPREGDIILQGDYERLGEYYGTAIMPARVRRPKDKASAEGSVRIIATAIMARLRNSQYSSFDALKYDISIKLKELNSTVMEKKGISRADALKLEATSLQPLPVIPFSLKEWKYEVKVAPNSHISYKKNFYSVPYTYIGQSVSVCEEIVTRQLKVYDKDVVIASHVMFGNHAFNNYSTIEEHMPDKVHKPEFDEDRIRKWAESVGPKTSLVIDRIFVSVKIKEQGYNPCLSVLKLSSKHGKLLLERACELALQHFNTPRYKHINAYLLEQIGKGTATSNISDEERRKQANKGAHIRGADYYKTSTSVNDEENL